MAGVVLAAGTSTRMGQNKLFMELDGEPLVRRVVGRASKAGFDPLIVVLGHEAELVQQALEGMPYRPVLNPEYERGVNSSLRAGIQAAAETPARAAVVVLADMPFVTTAMIETLVEKYRRSDAPLVDLGLRGRQRATHAVRPIAVRQSWRCRKARAAASTS